MKDERKETRPTNRWRGALGTHGAKQEPFVPELLTVDTCKLRAVLDDQAAAGKRDNGIATEISTKILELIRNYDLAHYKAKYARVPKNAVHRSTVLGWRGLTATQKPMDYRIVAAIYLLYHVDISAGRVFSPILQGRLAEYRVEFKKELRSNDPSGVQVYDLSPDPVSVLKPTVTIEYTDRKTGEALKPTFQMATFNVRLSVRVAKGMPSDRNRITDGWFIPRQEHLEFKNVLVAVAVPVRDGDLFSLDVAPKDGATEIHHSFGGLLIQPIQPWFTVNAAEDTEIEWTLLAPQSSVRITQTEPIENDVERLKANVRGALLREFLIEQSAFPEHTPLARSSTELKGPSQYIASEPTLELRPSK
ncbi:hypothetical protein J7426_15515 [Tropicibacter sp. R16_0]|uniref:hypothetical protein n=1 Tax=Tropicibacter sp. R16_0 TaxID=2821102 RepID=UPI001ADC7B28|nr:hypothetical protein [Tropicibacter sp. R16_0]MBO9451681.1 hypothetical protein [Tropicibacter sp. R16_0]